MNLKSAKNLIGSETEYNRYYTGFRGVDFSSDHSQVNEKRLAYLVNMYRDYHTGQGEALETVTGFRKRFVSPDASSPIYGIFQFDYRNENNETQKHIVIHAGKNLYLWKDNINETANVELEATINFTEQVTISGSSYYKQSNNDITFKSAGHIVRATYLNGESHGVTASREMFAMHDGLLCFLSSTPVSLNVFYYENIIGAQTSFKGEMNERKSVSFVFNNALYILDGKNYIKYDGNSFLSVYEEPTVPLRYQQIQVGENATTGYEYQQANLLNHWGVFAFIGDGKTETFKFPIPIKSVGKVLINGVESEYSSYSTANNEYTITFKTPPPESTTKNGNVEVYALLVVDGNAADISNCTLAEVYDDRVFLSGNPKYPNRIWFSYVNDPAYFGELNYEQAGVGNAPITGMMAVSDTLLVLKNDSEQEGTAYFFTGFDTDSTVYPRGYTDTRGLNGVGCLGACCNFLDDPVFISKLGLEAVGQLSVRLERAKEHRSSLVDAKLVNSNLKDASLCEWGGYLWVLVDGQIFLADSRQRWTNALGNAEYEWFYLNDIAVYDGQWKEFRYAPFLPDYLDTVLIDGYPLSVKEGYEGQLANEFDPEKGLTTIQVVTINGVTYQAEIEYVREVGDDGETHYYLCTRNGAMTGGTPHFAKTIASINENVYFGTDNGIVCSFNFDMRSSDGTMPTHSYSFNNRTIVSGCATLMDNCGILHLTKSTIKRSTVIKTKAFSRSAAKVRVRTNKNPYKQIARINNSTFSFEDVDFSDFSFITTDQTLYSIKEKEKHWVEKQYYVYSDEYRSPFALYYISYRYKVAGRLKT